MTLSCSQSFVQSIPSDLLPKVINLLEVEVFKGLFEQTQSYYKKWFPPSLVSWQSNLSLPQLS